MLELGSGDLGFRLSDSSRVDGAMMQYLGYRV